MYGIMIKQVKPETEIWGMLSLFSKEVWLVIGICLVVCVLVMNALCIFAATQERGKFVSLRCCSWYALSCMLNQGCNINLLKGSVSKKLDRCFLQQKTTHLTHGQCRRLCLFGGFLLHSYWQHTAVD